MNIEITARHFTLPDNVREHTTQKLERIERYIYNPIGCRVILEHENNTHSVEIKLSVSGKNIFVKDSSDNLLKSIDNAVDKLVARVKKFQEIRTSHS
ncbi:MAG: ribosome hibernation-promoting factor, HPF/YfiA family [Fidelibacterota bacterium]